MSDALENAFVLVLGQSCLLFVKLLIPIVSEGIKNEIVYIILVFTFINITCIIANWVSCRQKAEYTSDLSFFVDVLTLCVFFGVTYAFSENYQAMSIPVALRMVGAFYFSIHILFIVWNTIMLIRNREQNYFLMNTNYIVGRRIESGGSGELFPA